MEGCHNIAQVPCLESGLEPWRSCCLSGLLNLTWSLGLVSSSYWKPLMRSAPETVLEGCWVAAVFSEVVL